MLVQRRVMTWRRAGKSLQALVAHGLLFSSTILLVLKLHCSVRYPWWLVFSPMWLFHAVVARGRFSLPAPALPYDRHWAPFHAVMATPLLVAFEILLCIYLESSYGIGITLKIVFMPLLAFETAILVDNIRMCRALMPGDEEAMSDDVIWETLPHFWVSISMVFFIAATIFTLLKICGDVAALGWWDLFINFGHSHITEPTTPSITMRYLDWNRGLVISSEEDQNNSGLCDLQDIGGHIMKVPLIIFQILLFMYLEGTPSGATHLSIPVVFSPLLLLQGAGVAFAAYRLVEKIVILVRIRGSGRYGRPGSARYLSIASKVQDSFGFLHRGSRFLGWWSIDEGSWEEQARLYSVGTSGYDTFSPDVVKKMPKADLVAEIRRLEAALSEQTEITKFSHQAHERLQNEKILCRVCFEEQISIVLLPCRHHILCRTCGEKCKKCPICRVAIEERLPVYDV